MDMKRSHYESQFNLAMIQDDGTGCDVYEMIILVLFSLRKPECSLDAENVQWRRGGDEITLSSIYIFLVLVRVRVSCAHLLSDDV